MLGNRSIDDDLLRRFLLGAVPEEQAERLDELSISDDDLATRLQSVENDLVDAYVRGELSGETEQRFEARYLSTPERRNRIAVAEALLAHEQSGTRSRRFAPWAIAASVLLVVLAAAFFIDAPKKTEVRPPVASRVRPPTTTAAPVATISILLLPATRGAGAVPTVIVAGTTQRIDATLQLESDDFPMYRAALRDLVRNEIVWQSEALHATKKDGAAAVSMALPAPPLQEQNYSIELSGVPASGPTELMSSYTFRLVRKQRS